MGRYAWDSETMFRCMQYGRAGKIMSSGCRGKRRWLRRSKRGCTRRAIAVRVRGRVMGISAIHCMIVFVRRAGSEGI
jgi:hypothetical protein